MRRASRSTRLPDENCERGSALVLATAGRRRSRPLWRSQRGPPPVKKTGLAHTGAPSQLHRKLATLPIAHTRALCITVIAMSDTEAHQYRLGSPLASIVGIAEATLERDDLDEDVATRVRAIRDLALDALRKAERGDSQSGQPGQA
jgi:hypothetical protein